MYINRAEIDAAVSAYRTSRTRKAQSPAPTAESAESSEADLYVSSEEAASLADLKALVVARPLYREALVRELRRRVAEGRYYVPAEQIVERLLGRLVLEAMPA
jgi:anti-sigma28 factor (negative regulator of flagellin synthesis)